MGLSVLFHTPWIRAFAGLTGWGVMDYVLKALPVARRI